MKRLFILVILLMALLVALLLAQRPTPADAYPADADPVPTMRYPLPPNRDYGIAVQLNGPQFMWGMRKVAARIDNALPCVRIYRIGDHPNAYQVNVQIRDFYKPLAGDWGGLAGVWYRDPMWIKLNTRWGYNAQQKQYIAAHELGHILGIGHHKAQGAVGEGAHVYLQPNELDLLRDYYTPKN